MPLVPALMLLIDPVVEAVVGTIQVVVELVVPVLQLLVDIGVPVTSIIPIATIVAAVLIATATPVMATPTGVGRGDACGAQHEGARRQGDHGPGHSHRAVLAIRSQIRTVP